MGTSTAISRLPSLGEFSLTGWQGITVSAPSDWNLAAVGGDMKSGYLRLDDGDMRRLEVKWSQGVANTEKVLSRYLSQLSRRAKPRSSVSVERDVKILSRRTKSDKKFTCFRWQAPQLRACGAIWYCHTCGRTVVSQVTGTSQENVEDLSRQVLGSLEDHPRKGLSTWALYGLVCRVPETYVLQGQVLKAGYLELEFAKGRNTLRVLRWGMANVALSGKALESWLREQWRRRRDVQTPLAASPSAVRGHDGLQLSGARRKFMHLPRSFLAQVFRQKAANEFQAKAWHCPASNRIYCVEALGVPGEPVVDEVVSGLECHIEGRAD